MNDEQLSQALAQLVADRKRVAPTPAFSEQVLAIPETTTRERRWLPQLPSHRFQSMASATKFVVAGVIVALFGGFLLAGLLTQQPSDELSPVVGASASARPSPTAAVTASPSPQVAQGSFRAAGTLNEARYGHTATLLDDGRVLIVGGSSEEDKSVLVPLAETWDPTTESFEPAGAMIAPRYRHSATLLDDGRVLITGGRAGESESGLMEVWDPATETFEPAGALLPYVQHTATLLPDGRVLVVGKYERPSAYVWDPATETVERISNPPVYGSDSTATLLDDGRVLIVGQGEELLWDPVTETFEPADDGWVWRREHTTTLLPDGRVLLIGGRNQGKGLIHEAQLWDPATETFAHAGSLTDVAHGRTATLLPDGRVLVMGGEASTEVWDPTTSTFLPAASPSQQRRGHTATQLRDGRVLIVGGIGWEAALVSAEVWESGDERPVADMADEDTMAATTPDLLPGVDLEVEELQPGVFRVVSDGQRELRWDPVYEHYSNLRNAIVVGPDGAAWNITLPEDSGEGCRTALGDTSAGCTTFYRLGSPETYVIEDGYILQQGPRILAGMASVDVAPDGTMWAVLEPSAFADSELRSFDGEQWTVRRRPVEGRGIEQVVVGRDGAVWALWEGSGGRTRLGRLAEEGWSSTVVPSDGPSAPVLVAGAGGDVYLVDGDGAVHHLEDLDNRPLFVQGHTVHPTRRYVPQEGGGTFWWGIGPNDSAHTLVRYDGTDEMSFELDPAVDWGGIVAVGLDGAVWLAGQIDGSGCDGIHRFDGSEAQHFLAGTCPSSVDIAPDGSVWLQAGPGPGFEGLRYHDIYLITPQAWTESELRPE